MTADGGASWITSGWNAHIDIEDSQNCGGSNPARQSGRATRRVLFSVPTLIRVDLAGNVERQNAGFDLCSVSIDGEVVASVGGLGEEQGCAMELVNAQGEKMVGSGWHEIAVDADTVDGNFHVGAFFEADVSFEKYRPTCVPCGQAVDWVRSCYSHHWRLTRGTDATTRGQYYRVPKGTAHFPHPHMFWSKIWVSDEMRDGPELGEIQGRTQWTNGATPLRYPSAPSSVPDFPCWTEGGALVQGTYPMHAGFPLTCFPGGVPLVDPLSRRFLGLCMRAIGERFAGDPDAGEATFKLATDDAGAVTRFDLATTLPPGGMIQDAEGCLYVLIDGTASNSSLALQSVYGLLPPFNMGPYSTLYQWEMARVTWHERIIAVQDDLRRIVLCGHSMGAAVAALLAIRYKAAVPGREVILCTAGRPVLGDNRALAAVEVLPRFEVVNDGDIVPNLPPDAAALLSWSSLIAGAILTAWSRWEGPESHNRLSVDGELRYLNTSWEFVVTDLLPAAMQIALGLPVAIVGDHNMLEYSRRLLKIGV